MKIQQIYSAINLKQLFYEFFAAEHIGNFKMFSIFHITFMLVSAYLIYEISKRSKTLDENAIQKFLKFSAFFLLMFDPIYWLWEFITFHRFDLSQTLPLYFCSLFWILLPFAAFAPRNSVFERIALSHICTIGIIFGISGIVFSVHLNRYPFFSFVPIRSLIYHFFMILVPCVLWSNGYYKPKIQDSYLFFIPLAALFFPALILDKLYGWDYCYLNGGVGTPLEFLSKNTPNFLFIFILYFSIFVVINLIFYNKTIIEHFKKEKVFSNN
ncbi:MAG: YwaF family protein [Oscillospiraceae bacterium]